jgi:hypothetical protein
MDNISSHNSSNNSNLSISSHLEVFKLIYDNINKDIVFEYKRQKKGGHDNRYNLNHNFDINKINNLIYEENYSEIEQ